MDISSSIDMNYFWWVFNKLAAFSMPFLVIVIAICCFGLLLVVLILAFRKMGKG